MKIRRVVCLGFPLALAAVVAALVALRPVALKTSLSDLVGDGADAVPKSVRDASANLVPVIVDGRLKPPAPIEAVSEAARVLRDALPADCLLPDDANPLAAQIGRAHV